MRLLASTAGLFIWLGFACCPIAVGQITFVKHTVASLGQPLDVTVGDINSDGHPDLATVSNTDGEVAWWENNGQEGFVKKRIKIGFSGGRTIRMGDIDGDGDTDLIAASYTGNLIEWYENDGSGKFSTHVLDANFRGAHTVQLTDLDQDEDLDILCSGWDNTAALSELAWWENNGSESFTKHVVSSLMDQSPFVEATDIDLDGDLDLIGSDEVTGEVYWWENNGSQGFTEHLIDNQFTLAHTVIARDIDKDGDPDILASGCSSSLLAWYENKGAGVFEKHAMDNLSGAIWLDMADFDLDGDNDMVATGMGATQLALFTNNNRQVFAKSSIAGGLTSGFALNITDLDLDGDPDVVAIGYNSNFLGWWENTTDHQTLVKAPSWIVPGPVAGNYLVVNNDQGRIIATSDCEPRYTVANPGFCQGISVVGKFLYANSGSTLLAYHPETGIKIASYRTDAQYLDCMTSAPSGMLYLSASMDGTVIGFNPATGTTSIVAEGLDYPRALRYDPLTHQILLLDGESLIAVKSIDPVTGSVTTKEITGIPAGGDIATDGSGNYYISSPSANTIYVNTSGWNSPTYAYRTDLEGPWGMCYDALARELIVAMNGANKLERIPATANGIAIFPEEHNSSITAYPNPFTDHIQVRIPDLKQEAVELQLLSPDGKIIWSQTPGRDLNSSGVMEIRNLGALPAGVYYLNCPDKTRKLSLPLFHQR